MSTDFARLYSSEHDPTGSGQIIACYQISLPSAVVTTMDRIRKMAHESDYIRVLLVNYKGFTDWVHTLF